MKIEINDTNIQVIKDHRIVLLIPTTTKQFTERTVEGLLVLLGEDTKVVDLSN
jgi:hypothetical protein